MARHPGRRRRKRGMSCAAPFRCLGAPHRYRIDVRCVPPRGSSSVRCLVPAAVTGQCSAVLAAREAPAASRQDRHDPPSDEALLPGPEGQKWLIPWVDKPYGQQRDDRSAAVGISVRRPGSTPGSRGARPRGCVPTSRPCLGCRPVGGAGAWWPLAVGSTENASALAGLPWLWVAGGCGRHDGVGGRTPAAVFGRLCDGTSFGTCCC